MLSSVLALTFSDLAHAQSADRNADKAAAEALFNQGRALVQEGRFADACPKFEASQQLDAGLGTLLFLADCYEKAGRLASAWATFREAAGVARARGEHDRAQIANVRATALEPELLQLQLEALAPVPPGFTVKRNGVLVPNAALGTAVPVDAGTWDVRAEAPGHQPFEASVSLRQSDPKQPYVLRIPPLVPAEAEAIKPPVEPTKEPSSSALSSSADTNPKPPAAADPRMDSGDSQRTIGLIIGGAGIVAALASGVFTLLASSDHETSLGQCDPNNRNACSVEGKANRDRALSHATVATVAGVVGGIAIAGGAVLYFTAPKDEQSAVPTLNLGGTW